jgi:peptidoglycan/LPS O-acetylase OafA/YrhL
VYNLPQRLEYLSRGLGRPLSWPIAAAVVTLCFALVLVVALGWLDWARWKWLTVAGALTYPLYLIHQSIGYNVTAWLTPHVEKHVLLGGLVLTVLVLAWLIHRCVERPLAPWLKRTLTTSLAEMRHDGAVPASGGSHRR